MKIFSRKDRKIANLEAKVKNRDKLIYEQSKVIDNLKAIINSLEEDLKASRSASYEIVKELEEKKKTKRGRPKKEAE